MKILNKILRIVESFALVLSVISLTAIQTMVAHADEITYIDIIVNSDGQPITYDSTYAYYDGQTLEIKDSTSYARILNESQQLSTCTVSVTNYGIIGGGTFSGEVRNYNNIISGTFSSNVNNYGTITDGSFTGTVTNDGTSSGYNSSLVQGINGGTFSNTVNNEGVISGGTFNNTVNNGVQTENGMMSGTISGGTFTSAVIQNQNSTLEYGTFTDSSTITNNGTIQSASKQDGTHLTIKGTVINNVGGDLEYADYSGTVTNKGTIGGGAYTGTVTNDGGSVTNGYFANDILGSTGTIRVLYYDDAKSSTTTNTENVTTGGTIDHQPATYAGYTWSGIWYTDQKCTTIFSKSTQIRKPLKLYTNFTVKGVTSITVTTTNSSTSFAPGDTGSFNATVLPADAVDTSVTWSLEGDHISSTSIDHYGNLQIGEYETATSLVIKATSVQNTSISGSITISIAKLHFDLDSTEFVDQTVAVNGTPKTEIIKTNGQQGASIQYSSSVTSVATVDSSTGALTLISGGTSIITATVTGNYRYADETFTYKLTVTKSDPNIKFNESKMTVDYGSDSFYCIAHSEYSAGLITYTSNNESVATITNQGIVTTHGIGTAKITATIDATDTYASSSAECTIEVLGGIQSLNTDDFQEGNINFGEAASRTVTGPSDGGTITYKSSNESIVKVDTNTGALTTVGIGTAIITASAAAAGNYRLTEVECVLNVIKGTQVINTSNFADVNNKVYGNENFVQTVTLTRGDGAITYSSSNSNVATVNSTSGEVTITGDGTVTITATAASTDYYNRETAFYTLTVAKGAPEFNVTSFSDETKTYGSGTFQKTVTLSKGDGTISYASNAENVATVDNDGTITITGVGEATITATVTPSSSSHYHSSTVDCKITINPATTILNLTNFASESISYSQHNAQKTVTLTAGDGMISYTSSDTSVATINSATGNIEFLKAGTTTITASITKSKNYVNTSKQCVLTVLKADPEVQDSYFIQDDSTTYGSGTVQKTLLVSQSELQLTYSSDTPSVATVNATTGVVTLVSAGTAHITATIAGDDCYNTITRSYKLVVLQADQDVNADAFVNTKKNYGDPNFTKSVIVPENGGTVNYTCYPLGVASVNSTTGEVTILGTGTTTITATVSATNNYKLFTSSYTLEVAKGTQTFNTTNFAATGKKVGDSSFAMTVSLSKGNGNISYSSSNKSVATIDDNGNVSVVGAGNTVITASAASTDLYEAASTTYNLYISKIDQIFSSLNPVTKTYGDSAYTQVASLTTGNGAITYSSDNTAVAQVNRTSGEVTIQGAGTAKITATAAASSSYNATSISYELTVNRAQQILNDANFDDKSATYGDGTFTETVTRTTGDGALSYSSSNSSVANVESLTGKVTIVGAGTAVITAKAAQTTNYAEKTASYTLSVDRATQNLDVTNFNATTKYFGDAVFSKTVTAPATGGAITYSSKNPNVATIDSATGAVTIVGVGSSEISASAAQSTNYSASDTVTYLLTVEKGTQSFDQTTVVNITKTNGDSPFTAAVKLSKGNGAISYSSNNENVATIDTNSGMITIHTAGSAQITATASATDKYNQKSISYNLTVNKAAQIFNVNQFGNVSKNYGDANFTQTVILTTGDGDITYGSNNTTIATVDNNGEVTILNAGTAVITATAAETTGYEPQSVSYTLTVNKLDQVFDITSFANLTKNYDDASFKQAPVLSTGDGNVTFASSDTSVATVSSDGTVSILGTGVSTIEAVAASTQNYNEARASYTLTVNKSDPVVDTTEFKDITKGFNDTFTQAIKLTKGNGQVTYTSNDDTVAKVNETTGEVTVVGLGKAIITADIAGNVNYNGKSVTYTLTTEKKEISDIAASNVATTPGSTWSVAVQPSDATVTYQWYSDDTAVEGATESTYTVRQADAGKKVKVIVTGTGNYTGTQEYSAGPIVPKIIEGNDQKISTEEVVKKGLSMRFDGAVDLVIRVSLTINGVPKILKENVDYTLKSGSTIVILSPSLLATLKPGTYYLSVYYGNNTPASGKFILSGTSTNDVTEQSETDDFEAPDTSVKN